MRIAAQATFSVVEHALQEVADTPSDEPLTLPTNLKHLAGGAEAALTQAIITWAQAKKPTRLETWVTTEAQAQEFVRRLPLLAAVLCSNEAVGPDREIVSAALTSAALQRLDRLQSPQARLAYRGSSAEIVCADHLGRDAPYLLYLPDRRGGSRLRPRENFRDLARWLLKFTIPNEYIGLFDPEAPDAIGAMLYEIFKNTEEHALVNEHGDLLDVSIRAVKTNHHAVTPETLARIVESFPPLAAYCTTLAPPAEAAQTHLFEISILDSGPGFAVTWTGSPLTDLSFEAEENAVRECFGSGSAKGESRFGEGLPHVLRILRRERGFLRLRTGRLSFYADFSGEAEEPVLQRHVAGELPGGARAAGTLLTILLPMRRHS